jgi:hypothetical protein
MRKILFVLSVLLLSAAAYSESGFTYYWTIADGDTVTKTKWKANNDSVLNWASRASDTMNGKAWWGSATHDSTYWRVARNTKIKIDSTATTDSVNARGVTFQKIVASACDTGTLPDTLINGLTTTPTSTFLYSKIGNMVTVHLNAVTGTSNSSSLYISGIPAVIRTTKSQYIPICLEDNTAIIVGIIDPSGSGDGVKWYFYNGALGGLTTSGTKGLVPTTFTYYK